MSALPEVGADFGVSAATASATITAYLVPFAVVMLFSGTWGARWGMRRTVVAGYLVYVVSSLLCVVAPTFELLLAGRAVMGVANAFTTPLLLATIATATPRERLGRALGLFASLQAAGQTSGPLFGGLAAETDWRLVFVGAAAVALALAAIGLPPAPAAPAESRVSLRAAWRPAVLRASAVAMVGWGCLGGITFLVAFRVDDTFGLDPGARGVLLTAFGVVGILTARPVGHWVERVGGRRAALIGAVAAAVPVALLGLVPSLVAVLLAWAAAGLCAQLVLVGLNALVLTDEDQRANRAGSISVMQAFRFVGAAAAPLVLTPVYHLHPAAGFLLPAALLAVTAPLALATARPRAGRPPPR